MAITLWVLPCGAASPEILVTFDVQLPQQFNTVGRAYLAGNHKSLGDWVPNTVQLIRSRGNRLSATVRVPMAYPIEFKVNLGDWNHGETLANGKERSNRTFSCLQSCTVPVKVENFRLKVPHPVPQTAALNVYYHHDLYSAAFGNYRSLAVLLPAEYFTQTSKRFPVLYALDGNNLFDKATSAYGAEWGMDETLNTLFARQELPPFIVVGVYNTAKRADEYLSCKDPLSRGPMGEEYARFLGGEVKPMIDKLYRTLPDRKNTALMGSSFGGSFTLFTAKHFGATFSRFLAMSPALWWSNRCILNLFQAPFSQTPDRLWMDMGDREGFDDGAVKFRNGVQELKMAEQLMLQNRIISSRDLSAFVAKGGIHHESSWGARLGQALKFLYRP